MIQYKLIKEYPGSPKLGTLANKEFSFSSDSYMLSDKFHQPLPLGRVENHPEFWQKVEEVDYEILSFYSGHSDDKMAYIFKKTRNGLYSKGSGDCDLDHALKYWNIHSVKRLSDGCVFSIGDKVYQIEPFINETTWIIKEFSIKDTRCFTIGVNIDCIEKSKTPLFTTEDGVGVLGGDKYYWVCIHNEGWNAHKAELGFNLDSFSIPQNVKTFSTKEKAEEYILRNKPCLSLMDLLRVREDAGMNKPFPLFEKLEELAKSRL